MLPWGSIPEGGRQSQSLGRTIPARVQLPSEDRQGSTHTRPIGDGLLGVQLLGANRGARFEFGLGELGQVGHDRMFIHVGVHDLLGRNHLPGRKESESVLHPQHPAQGASQTQPHCWPSLGPFALCLPGAPRASRPPAAWPPGRSAQAGWGPRPPSQGKGLERWWREVMTRGKRSARTQSTCSTNTLPGHGFTLPSHTAPGP